VTPAFTPQPAPTLPAVLRDVQSVVQGHWRATGEELYREVAGQLGLASGSDLLVAGCGDGVTSEWLAARTGATVTGVDADRRRVERAERRVRSSPARLPVSFEHHELENLPHEASVFDATLGEPFLAAARDPAQAIAELVRVTKPMGVVVLLQLTWSTEIADSTCEILVERLGVRPHHLVEWKQMLRDAGVVDIDVQDWSDGPLGRAGVRPGDSRAPRLSLTQKVHIVGRAWRRWGWRAGAVGAARGALESEAQLLRELSRERAVGFQLIRGVKWPHARTRRRGGST
jgi:SAM-dependent methyltransferase